MNFPRTYFSTPLSGLDSMTRARIQNIVYGQRKRPPVWLMALVVLMIAFCGSLVSCQPTQIPKVPDPAQVVQNDPNSSYTVPDSSEPVPQYPFTSPGGDIDSQADTLYALINDFYDREYPTWRHYWAVDMPDQPQYGDIMLGSVTYLGSGYAGTQLGSAYEVERRWYSLEQDGGWSGPDALEVLVLTRGADGALAAVAGRATFPPENLSAEEIISRVIHDVTFPELVLYRDGCPYPLAVFSRKFVPYANDYVIGSEPQMEIFPDWEAIYSEGSYWATLSWEGMSVLCCYNADEDAYYPNSIDVTRDDLYTVRGIHVGSSREEVLAAYPDLESAQGRTFWGVETEGQDVLWYNVVGVDYYPEVMLFFFEGDALSRIVLHFSID